MYDLEEWAKKARAELNNHKMFVVGEGTDEAEDRNNEEVYVLCEEYDKIMKNRHIRLC